MRTKSELSTDQNDRKLPATYRPPTLVLVGSVREWTMSGLTSTVETKTGGNGCSANLSKRLCL